jgi:hypothetical protein
MDWERLPTLDEILARNLLPARQLAQLEAWYRASLKANRAVALAPSLSQALCALMAQLEAPKGRTLH